MREARGGEWGNSCELAAALTKLPRRLGAAAMVEQQGAGQERGGSGGAAHALPRARATSMCDLIQPSKKEALTFQLSGLRWIEEKRGGRGEGGRRRAMAREAEARRSARAAPEARQERSRRRPPGAAHMHRDQLLAHQMCMPP